MNFASLLKRIVYRERASSESYIKYLRKLGVDIGEDCTFYAPSQSPVDIQYPWMISIGNHVRITAGVKILTHDYSWSVLKLMQEHEGEILGASGHVIIGNNVFVGRGAIITRNVKIGDNVIIGAGSVVTRDCDPNSIYAGNPAHKISDLEHFYEKRKAAQLLEAKELVCAYVKRYHKKPEPEVLHEYFMLFCNDQAIMENSVFKKKIELCNNADQSLNYMKSNKPLFDNYKDFLDYCLNEEQLH